MSQKISALITAAGYSQRMGNHKALLKYNDTQSFLERIIECYFQINCDEIVITASTALNEKIINLQNGRVKIVENQYPELERIYSIKIGLQALTNVDFCFIHAVDNPFVKTETLLNLYENKEKEQIIAPYFQNKGGHPILINKKIINLLINNTDYQLKLNQFLSNYPKLKIETEDENILININTEAEYKEVIRSVNC